MHKSLGLSRCRENVHAMVASKSTELLTIFPYNGQTSMQMTLKMCRYNWLFLAIAFLMSPFPLTAADHAFIPGTGVALIPPPGFKLSESSPGYESADQKARIFVSEVPVPAATMQEAIMSAGGSGEGLTLIGTEHARISGRAALLINMTQSVSGAVFEMWLAVFGDSSQTVRIEAIFPQSSTPLLSQAIKQSLLSARWEPTHELSQFDALPYRLTWLGSLKIAERIMTTIVLTKDGTLDSISPGNPYLVVGASRGRVNSTGIVPLAHQRLGQLEAVTGLTNIEGHAVDVAGLPAYELTADARDAETDEPVLVYQMLALDADVYFEVQGVVGGAHATRYVSEFRRIAASLQLTR